MALNLCPGTDPVPVIEAVASAAPGVRVVTEDGSRAQWMVEACATGTSAISTLTDLATGATETRSVPAPADAGPEGPRRLLARIVHEQVRSAVEAARINAGSPEPSDPPMELPAPEPPTWIAVSVGIEAVGGIDADRQAAQEALGPSVSLSAHILDFWALAFRAGITPMVGIADGASVDLIPLRLDFGIDFLVDPVRLGVDLSGIAEQWRARGPKNASGWRGGAGLTFRLEVPVYAPFEVGFRTGIDAFPQAVDMGDENVEPRVFLAQLPNWRWFAAFELSLSFAID